MPRSGALGRQLFRVADDRTDPVTKCWLRRGPEAWLSRDGIVPGGFGDLNGVLTSPGPGAHRDAGWAHV